MSESSSPVRTPARHLGTGTLAGPSNPSRARAAPPLSRSQYHNPNATTFVSQMAPPAASKVRALSVNGWL